jgi:hypothetical protein
LIFCERGCLQQTRRSLVEAPQALVEPRRRQSLPPVTEREDREPREIRKSPPTLV